MSFGIFANNGFFMVASHIVPFDTIIIEIIQNSHTGLFPFTGIGLLFAGTSGVGPFLERSSICGIHLCVVSSPEPSIDVLGEEIISVAAIKVTQTSRGPDVFGTSKSLLKPIGFSFSFNADQIHTTFAAVVPGVKPIPAAGSYSGVV